MSLRVKKFLRGEGYLDPGFVVVKSERTRNGIATGKYSYTARGTSGGKNAAVILSYDKAGANPSVQQLEADGVRVLNEPPAMKAARMQKKAVKQGRKDAKDRKRLC